MIICGDSLTVLPGIPDAYVDLIMTSPPYANRREWVYGGIPADKYVSWFMPIASELERVLKPTGSFVLNIKEHCEHGERHTYVLELIIAMRAQGWLWTEEYIWHKTTAMPGKWPNRFRDEWERILHFTRGRQFKMFQDEVMVPVQEDTIRRAYQGSPNDDIRTESKTGSKFGRRITNWQERELAYPSNVIMMSPQRNNRYHSAVFPEALPEWFIRLFTEVGDAVLDPFAGSGTTGVAAKCLGRRFILIDNKFEYCQVARRRLEGVQAPGKSFIELIKKE